jgi:NTE family protein
VLSVLLSRLVKDDPNSEIMVIGTSAGAINTAILAGFASPAESVREATRLWTSIGLGDVFTGLRSTVLRDAGLYLSQVLRPRGHHLDSLLDSSPLHRTMTREFDWDRMHERLDSGCGWVSTAGVVTTGCESGRTVVFLEGRAVEVPWTDSLRGIDYVPAQLGVPHVLASAAIPGAFLPVSIEHPPGRSSWYVDGGVRLNCPIQPALTLGADRVVVVATTPDPDQGAAPIPRYAGKPDVFDVAGVVMHSILVDRMAEDIRSLRRTNALLMGRGRSPRQPRATAHAGRNSRSGRGRGDRYRLIPHLYVGPPQPGIISAAANRFLRDQHRRWTGRLSDLGVLAFLVGGSAESHGELLSFLLFDSEFLGRLIELGQAHAELALGAGSLPWRDARAPAHTTGVTREDR